MLWILPEAELAADLVVGEIDGDSPRPGFGKPLLLSRVVSRRCGGVHGLENALGAVNRRLGPEWQALVARDGGSHGEHSSVKGGHCDGFVRVWVDGGCR